MSYIPALNAFGQLSAIGDTINANNDAANQQALQAWQLANQQTQQNQANAALGLPSATVAAPPQPQSFLQRLINGLSGGASSGAAAAQNGFNGAVDAAFGNSKPAASAVLPAASSSAPLPAKDAYSLYRNSGLPDSGARAVIAGLQGESGQNLDPNSQNNSGTENGGIINPKGSFGVANWNGPRQEQLLNYARQTGGDPTSATTQHNFVMWDMQHNYPDVWQAVNDPNLTDQQKLAAFVNRYENPKDKAGAIAARTPYLAQDFGNATSAPANQVAALGASDATSSPVSKGTQVAANGGVSPDVVAQAGTVSFGGRTFNLAQAYALANNPSTKLIGEALIKKFGDQSGSFVPLTPEERSSFGVPSDDSRVWIKNTLTGKPEAISAEKDKDRIPVQVIGEDRFGNKQYGYVKGDGSVVPVKVPTPEGDQESATPGAPLGNSGLKGEDYIASIDPKMQGRVRAVIEGREPFPSGRALTTPFGQELAYHVQQADPTFEVGNATSRIKSRAEFTTGAQNSPASQIQAGNTAIDHLALLIDKANALPSNAGAGFGPIGSYVTGKVGQATTAGQAATESYKAEVGNFAKEMVRYLTGGEGTIADREGIMKTLSPDLTPEARKQVIAGYIDQMNEKKAELQNRWHNAMGPMVKDFPVRSQQASDSLDKIAKWVSPQTEDGTAPAATPGQSAAQAPRQSLPSGATPALAVQQAKDAIAAGKDPAAVAARLKGWGIDPSLYGIGAQ